MVLSHIHLLRVFNISSHLHQGSSKAHEMEVVTFGNLGKQAEYFTSPRDPSTHYDLIWPQACTLGSVATVGPVIYITALMCFNDGVTTISLKGE